MNTTLPGPWGSGRHLVLADVVDGQNGALAAAYLAYSRLTVTAMAVC